MSKHNAKYLTPFNVFAAVIIIAGSIITVMRFTQGLGPVTNLSDDYPWGLWIGFDLMCGVALAAGGFVTSSAAYLFGMKRLHAAVRPAILTGFLGYFFVVIALFFDLGRPWRLPYPFIRGFGTTSILFEVALCVSLYLTVLFLEFAPAPLEWLGLRKTRDLVLKLTVALTIFGATLSTLHQSSLGALFLIAPAKLHPLWYSHYLPVFFFISSIVAGLSMVIFESSLAHRALSHKMDEEHLKATDCMPVVFGKTASWILAGYFILKVFGVAQENHWALLFTPYGAWFLVETLGFVALPCLLFGIGARDKNVKLVKMTSVLAILGIVLNRLNVSVIAFNWHLPWEQKYFPDWKEIVISVFMVTLLIVIYRFITLRMPVLHEHPKYKH